jgi:hypothetical protein
MTALMAKASGGKTAILDNLPNQCLGIRSGVRCSVRLPRGSHTCPTCQGRINKGSKFDNSAMGTGGNHRRGNLLTGQDDMSSDCD